MCVCACVCVCVRAHVRACVFVCVCVQAGVLCAVFLFFIVCLLSLTRLTVTDEQKATSSSDVTVTVLPEQDYPPTANAGDPVLIHLPNNEVTLSGKKSSDDKVSLGSCFIES